MKDYIPSFSTNHIYLTTSTFACVVRQNTYDHETYAYAETSQGGIWPRGHESSKQGCIATCGSTEAMEKKLPGQMLKSNGLPEY